MAEKRYNLNEEDRDKLSDLLADRPKKERPQRHRQVTPRQSFGGIPFENGSGVTIPAFAVMQIDDADLDRERPYVTVRKPEAGGKLFIFNGPREVPESGHAIGYREGRALVSEDAATTSLYSPLPGEWELSSGGGHFRLAGELDDDTGYFLLVGAEFGIIKGQLVGALSSSTTSHTIDNVELISGADPRADPESTSEAVTVSNELLCGAGADDAEFLALWDATNEEWIFIAGKHEAVTVLTDWRVDGSTMKLQYKTRAIVVMVGGDESEWTDAHTGTEECEEPEE